MGLQKLKRTDQIHGSQRVKGIFGGLECGRWSCGKWRSLVSYTREKAGVIGASLRAVNQRQHQGIDRIKEGEIVSWGEMQQCENERAYRNLHQLST